jgi:electron transfer flavoprotein alpha subunit
MNQDVFVLIEHVRGKVADISYMMLAQARQITDQSGGQVVALLLGHNVNSLADRLNADRVWQADHPALEEFTWDGYLAVLAEMVKSNPPRLVLFGDTTLGAGLAGGLSARLGMPLVSYCRSLTSNAGSLEFTSQVYGGKLLAQGSIPPETTCVAMIPGVFKTEEGLNGHMVETTPFPIESVEAELIGMRVTLKKYLEPEAGDVDITREPILIGVGRGIQRQDNLELAEELAESLGGVVCGTRPLIDQGWLPVSRLVGKSGKTVKPKLYLALGISGAPEHTEAMSDGELIIAVNTDPKAPIFDLAKYGAEADILDLMPALTEKIRQAKG